ncbi:ThiF family adenylyltransferase [Haliea sp. E1-2-M8]|uniref:ThiF family adenylyltransferase n=1 Tax=Haliea sp. E1-2-M8 TaxID=3064706 RepID=UPI00272258D5|nr:ThiF family adenylyltransferase [Haliea sp. E1-2-M8]MDO8863753.1 ThiF family adenylyltransferase [Haliea sp. E1-2-M8]
MTTDRQFDYAEAFSRNSGWVTAAEQASLRGKRIAIAGMGGVGGIHLLTLARLGVGAFSIADFDTFDIANFNRQAGATMSTLGRPKTTVMTEMARDINPELDIRAFADGVTAANVDTFLEGADLYVDGLDFFAFDARDIVFSALVKQGIPAVIVAPLGMGASLLNFMPGGMTFADYFDWEGCTPEDKALRFLIGLSPALLQRTYLMDASATDMQAERVPSTPVGSELAAGVATTEALKILLGRGKVIAAPRGVHYDAYRNKLVRTWRPGGNRNPIQRLALAFARRTLDKGRG